MCCCDGEGEKDGLVVEEVIESVNLYLKIGLAFGMAGVLEGKGGGAV